MPCEVLEGRISINRLMIKHEGEKRECIIVLFIALVSLPQGDAALHLSAPLFHLSFSLSVPSSYIGRPLTPQEWAALRGVKERLMDRRSDICKTEWWHASSTNMDSQSEAKLNNQSRVALPKNQAAHKIAGISFFHVKSIAHLIYWSIFVPKWEYKRVCSALVTYWPVDKNHISPTASKSEEIA